jgi:hypothetical protein
MSYSPKHAAKLASFKSTALESQQGPFGINEGGTGRQANASGTARPGRHLSSLWARMRKTARALNGVY